MILLDWFTGWLSAYTATTATEGNADLSSFPSNPGEKPLFSPGRALGPTELLSTNATVWMSETQQRGMTRKKMQADLFSIRLLSWKSPRCLRFLGQPSTTQMTQLQLWGSVLFQDCHIDQLAGGLASLSQSDTKGQTWKIRLTRKYVQKSSNKYKAITLTVVNIQYQVIPSGKEQSTF